MKKNVILINQEIQSWFKFLIQLKFDFSQLGIFSIAIMGNRVI